MTGPLRGAVFLTSSRLGGDAAIFLIDRHATAKTKAFEIPSLAMDREDI